MAQWSMQSGQGSRLSPERSGLLLRVMRH